MKRHGTSERGFTLVELLVVIGIIVILIGMLLPVLNRVRQQAQQTACAANLHQQGLAMTMYTGQYKFFPAAFIQVDGGMASCWPVRLRKIMGGNQKVFYCPAQPSECEWKPDAAGTVLLATAMHTNFGYEIGERLLLVGNPTGNGAWFSYGLNTVGAHEAVGGITGPQYIIVRGVGEADYLKDGTQVGNQSSLLRATSVKRASEFILMGDSRVDGDRDTVISPYDAPGHEGVGNIHRGGANILYMDGHVQWNLQRELLVKFRPIAEEAAKQRIWNADGEATRVW